MDIRQRRPLQSKNKGKTSSCKTCSTTDVGLQPEIINLQYQAARTHKDLQHPLIYNCTYPHGCHEQSTHNNLHDHHHTKSLLAYTHVQAHITHVPPARAHTKNPTPSLFTRIKRGNSKKAWNGIEPPGLGRTIYIHSLVFTRNRLFSPAATGRASTRA